MKTIIRSIIYAISFVILLPLTILSALHLISFENAGIIVSLVPTQLGVFLRRVWYKMFLAKCGKNLFVDFLGVIITKKAEVGNNVYVGKNSFVGACVVGDDVVISHNCSIFSGKNQHTFYRENTIASQMGKALTNKSRLKIGKDCFIGHNSVIANDLAKGVVVGALTFVNKPFEPYSVIGGVPAKFLKSRPKKDSK